MCLGLHSFDLPGSARFLWDSWGPHFLTSSLVILAGYGQRETTHTRDITVRNLRLCDLLLPPPRLPLSPFSPSPETNDHYLWSQSQTTTDGSNHYRWSQPRTSGPKTQPPPIVCTSPNKYMCTPSVGTSTHTHTRTQTYPHTHTHKHKRRGAHADRHTAAISAWVGAVAGCVEAPSHPVPSAARKYRGASPPCCKELKHTRTHAHTFLRQRRVRGRPSQCGTTCLSNVR